MSRSGPRRDAARPSGHLIVFGACNHYVMGGGILALMYVLGPDGWKGNYFSSLIMVCIVIAILTPWKPSRTAIQISILTLGYLIAAILYFKSISKDLPPEVISNWVLATGAGVLCWYGAWQTDLIRMASGADARGQNDDDDVPDPFEMRIGPRQIAARAAMVLVPIGGATFAYATYFYFFLRPTP